MNLIEVKNRLLADRKKRQEKPAVAAYFSTSPKPYLCPYSVFYRGKPWTCNKPSENQFCKKHDPSKPRCRKRVSGFPCGRIAKVKHGKNHFCHSHDPEKVAHHRLITKQRKAAARTRKKTLVAVKAKIFDQLEYTSKVGPCACLVCRFLVDSLSALKKEFG